MTTRLLFLITTVSSLISTVAEASTAGTPQLPSFVSHVTSEDVEEALKIAQRRHDFTVQKAISEYDTDSIPAKVDESVATTKFRKLSINAPGSLPDFGDELERAIYVTDPPLLSKEECNDIIQKAEDFVGDKPWGLLPSGQYNISGFWIKDASPEIQKWFATLARQRLFPLFQRLYPDFVQDPSDLCVDSAYLFKYNPETGRRTEVHTDCGM